MSKNEVKKVSNLTVKIGKAMDIITSCDFSKIKFNLFLFQQIDNELTIQIKKYAKFADYELDFTVNDIADLSNAIYDFLINFPQKFLYSKYKKNFANYRVITGDMFDTFTTEIADQMNGRYSIERSI